LEHSYLYPLAASATWDDGPPLPQVIPLPCTFSGVYLAKASRPCWYALTAPLHPYLPRKAVFISVALSSRSRALGITQQPALRCPDFPHRLLGDATVCATSRLIILPIIVRICCKY